MGHIGLVALRERKIRMCNIAGNIGVFAKHVGSKIPHSQRRGLLKAFHLLFEGLKGMFDSVVRE